MCTKDLQGSALQRADSGFQDGSILASMIKVVGKELEVVQGLFYSLHLSVVFTIHCSELVISATCTKKLINNTVPLFDII